MLLYRFDHVRLVDALAELFRDAQLDIAKLSQQPAVDLLLHHLTRRDASADDLRPPSHITDLTAENRLRPVRRIAPRRPQDDSALRVYRPGRSKVTY